VKTDLSAYSLNRPSGLPLVRDSGGEAGFKVDRRRRTVDDRVDFRDIASGVIMAHIHLGNSWQDGPIMVWLCETPGAPAPAGTTAPTCPPGTDGTIGGTFGPEAVLGPGGEQIAAGDFDTLLNLIDAGAAYVLVHSNELRPGEIRGQFAGGR
jgi:hypothetical protein